MYGLFLITPRIVIFCDHLDLPWNKIPLLILHGRTSVSMGIGWTTSSTVFNSIHDFKGKASQLPSSTRAEAFAILTVLIVCPLYCAVTIWTDSQACIDSFSNNRNHHVSRRKK